MTLSSQMASKQLQTIYRASRSSRGASTKPTFGAPAAMSVYVEPSTREVPSGIDGSTTVLSNTLILSESEIKREDRIWLPGVDQTNGELAEVVKWVDPITDFDGTVSHYEVYV